MLLVEKILNKRAAIFFGLLIWAVLTLVPIAAEAQCTTGWDASGKWSIKQAGSPYTNDLTLEQKGRVITGVALTYRETRGGIFIKGGKTTISGTVDGTIDGDNLSIQIFWRDGLTGVYNGKFLPSGRLDGVAWEKASPSRTQTWYSVGVLKCPPPPAPAAPPPPKPLRSTGKAKINVIPLPLPEGTLCTQWDVSGPWNIEVKSGPRKGYVVNTLFRQSGKNLSGSVTDGGSTTGTVNNGMSDGETFNAYISWSGTSADGSNAEVYVGKISANGIIEGTALIIGDRSQNAKWSSDRAMKCVKSGPAPPKPPYIVAGPVIVPTPSWPFGSVHLGWDGGPDNPNVEIWVSVNNGPETPAYSIEFPPGHPLFKQAKASFEMKLPRSSGLYKYVLKAAGKTLSSVSFYLQ